MPEELSEHEHFMRRMDLPKKGSIIITKLPPRLQKKKESSSEKDRRYPSSEDGKR